MNQLPGKWRHWSSVETVYDEYDEVYNHVLAIKTRSLYLKESYWNPFQDERYITIRFNEIGLFEEFSMNISYFNDTRPYSLQWRTLIDVPKSMCKTMAFELGELEQDARYNFVTLFQDLLVASDLSLIIYEYASDLLDMILYCKSKAVGS